MLMIYYYAATILVFQINLKRHLQINFPSKPLSWSRNYTNQDWLISYTRSSHKRYSPSSKHGRLQTCVYSHGHLILLTT
ncbi:hypothetical protein MtrunA17_Chr1g0152081 [Medicago truncatula]|uniref:Uncharacterized protein n=1 Tax=Medicago truncatula TaxID=3880 RepID=A0A396JKG5_MEDTR|nr:hypothetical protein MtrunA17_Chr1g0152081 [Medicago truncatula]